MQDAPKSEQEQAADMIAAVYKDGFAEIHGRKYSFMKMQHLKRKQVFAFYTHVKFLINDGDFSFLTSREFEPIERIISDYVTFDGMQISKLPDHWEACPEDYVQYICTALAVISHPFFRGAPTS